MTGRRAALFALSTGLLSAPTVLFAQTTRGKVPTIGILIAETMAGQSSRIEAFRLGLRDHGYVEGRSIAIVFRLAEGSYDRLPELAAELTRLDVDVLVAFGVKALVAAKGATSSIPIVIPVTSSDPVALGLVVSLARPGGNITGSTNFGPEIMAKRLEVLKEAVPGISRIAVLVNPANSSFGPTFQRMGVTAKALKLSLQPFEVQSPSEFDKAFASLERARIEALVIQDDTMFGANARSIAEIAVRKRMPSIGSKSFAEAGAMIGLGANEADLYRRGAYFVDRILKGSRPQDLPMEQATRLELVVNIKTAQAIGLKVPQAMLLRANDAIR